MGWHDIAAINSYTNSNRNNLKVSYKCKQIGKVKSYIVKFELHFIDNDIYIASHKTNYYSTFIIHLSQTRTG